MGEVEGLSVIAEIVTTLRDWGGKRPSDGLVARQNLSEDSIIACQAVLLAAADTIETRFAGRKVDLTARVIALVEAARDVAFGDDHKGDDIRALDAASEEFAEDVPWEDGDDALGVESATQGHSS